MPVNPTHTFTIKITTGTLDISGEPVGHDLMLVEAPSGDHWIFSRSHGLPLPHGKFTNEFDARRFLRCIRHLPWEKVATDALSRQKFIEAFYHELRHAREAVLDVADHQDPEIRFKAYMHRLHKRADLMAYMLGK